MRWSFYLLFILVPLILTPWNFELFEYNKMMLTYGLTAIILGAWIIKMIEARELRVARTPLDIPLWIFIASQLVSTLFSMDPHVSWFGYYSRFNGGMFSIFSYTALYYAFVTNFAEIMPMLKKQNVMAPVTFRLTRLVKVMITTAAVVSIYAVLEHFGIDKNLWVQDVQSRVFSTLGQPNWLAAYLVALIPIAIGLAIKFQIPSINNQTNQKLQAKNIENLNLKFVWNLEFVTWSFCAVLFFIVLLWTRSRSGYLGLAVADAVFWGFLLLSSRKKLSFKAPQSSAFIILHVVFIIIVFFNGIYVDQIDKWVTLQGWRDRFAHKQIPSPKTQFTPSGTALESGGTESGTIRKYVWQGAVTAWLATPKNMIIGTGTETFAFAFYQYRPAGHNLTSEWDFLYNKAHNEYLNYLATTGLFGLGSYLFLLGSFIYWFVKRSVSASARQRENNDAFLSSDALSLALFAGWVSILSTNFFGFSVVIMQLFLFLLPAIVVAQARAVDKYEDTSDRVFPLKISANVILYGSLITIGAAAALLLGLYRFWQADTYYASANRLGRAGQNDQAKVLDTQAIAINPGEPVYHDDLSSALAALSITAAQNKNATLAATLAKQSLAESAVATNTSPQNVNFWKTRTKLYYTFSAFDPTLNTAAIQALEKAQSLSPHDPKIYYNLAILYGREGNNDKALQLLNKAKTLKPDYRDAYFGLYVFYSELKETDKAKNELQTYLSTVDPNDKDFQDRLKQLK